VTSPRLSFIVVTHRRPQFLPRALDSIRRQTIADREIVVVVNGPDAETRKVLDSLGSEARVTELPNNYGVGAGRNAGIDLSRGEILFFLDDDAELGEPDIAAKALAHFERDSNLAVVSLPAFNANTNRVEPQCIPLRYKRLPQKPTEAGYFCGCACLIRRRVFDRVGLFDKSLFYTAEELDLSYRALEAGFRILFDPSLAVIHYRAGERKPSMPLYFQARNRPWVALRHLPLLYFATHCFAWWGWSLAKGARERAMGAAVKGIRDCVRGMPAVWDERNPISRTTRQNVARNKGRLWC
jgi:GT2 family glycosyltransferase